MADSSRIDHQWIGKELHMFDQFRTPIMRSTIDLETVVRLTGLEWQQYPDADLPREAGVYGWFHPANDALIYPGKGDGVGGLHTRLNGHLRWREGHRRRMAEHYEASTDASAWFVASEVPVVRQIAESDLQLWFAIAQYDPWSLEGGYVTPETAVEWESFLMETMSLIAGSRSLIGGGAWESKPNSLGRRMQVVAWRRLMDLGVEW